MDGAIRLLLGGNQVAIAPQSDSDYSVIRLRLYHNQVLITMQGNSLKSELADYLYINNHTIIPLYEVSGKKISNTRVFQRFAKSICKKKCPKRDTVIIIRNNPYLSCENLWNWK
mgnify:CR=1 FL=1